MKYAILLAVILTACATAGKMKDTKIGMSRAQVIATLGEPVSVSAQGNVELLNYSLSETDDQAFLGVTRGYFVRLVDGKVESYGRTGDFPPAH